MRRIFTLNQLKELEPVENICLSCRFVNRLVN